MSAPVMVLANEMRDWALAQSKARPVVKRILRSHLDDVEDVLQESVLKALVAQESFRGSCKFSTWFTRIAINSALMRLRRYKAQHHPASLEALSEENRKLIKALAIRPQALENIWQNELRGLLLEEIAKLAPLLQTEALCYLDEDYPLRDNVRKSRKFRMLRDLLPLVAERLGGSL